MQQTMQRPAPVGNWWLARGAELGGAIAGLSGGIAMIALSPLLSWLSGISIWDPPTYIAATVLGSAVLEQTGFPLAAVVVGTLLHLAVSVMLGLIFGVVYHRVLRLTTEFGLPLYAGLIYGLFIFMLAYFAVLPAVDPTLLVLSAGMGPLLVQNLAFALCLGLFYMLGLPTPYHETLGSR